MAQFRDIMAGVSVKISNVFNTTININGVQTSPFQGRGHTCGPSPASPAFTRSAAASVTHAPIPVPGPAWRRKNAKKVVVAGGVFRLDGGPVDPTLKRKYSQHKRRAPKRQFTKKPKPSSSAKPPSAPKRHRVPLATRVALVDSPVGTSLSRSGRVIKKSAQFDPSLLRSKIKSISRRNKDGLYSVVMLMTEEEVLEAGGANVLNAFARAKK